MISSLEKFFELANLIYTMHDASQRSDKIQACQRRFSITSCFKIALFKHMRFIVAEEKKKTEYANQSFKWTLPKLSASSLSSIIKTIRVLTRKKSNICLLDSSSSLCCFLKPFFVFLFLLILFAIWSYFLLLVSRYLDGGSRWRKR